MTLRVLVADDQPIVRAGLASILDSFDDLQVVGRAADGAEAVELARRLRPDVCLLDIRMPGVDGIRATELLAGPGVVNPVPIVIITTFDTDENVYAALRAGARGFLLKGARSDQLADAVRAAHTGDALIDPGVTARLLGRLTAAQPQRRRVRMPVEQLSAREEDVLAAVARGRTNAEIADDLFISLSTVKFHIAALMMKLQVRNRVELAIWAYESGRVDAP